MAPHDTEHAPTVRRLPIGVEPIAADGDRGPVAHARVWAPACRSVELVIEEDGAVARAVTLDADGDGYFSGEVAGAPAGTRYRFRLDGGDAFPDPASRYQPDGPHGPSMIVDPSAYEWTDAEWRGVSIEGQVIYEVHVGTFTSEGTFRAAIERLPELVDVGVTVLELMPVADFPGRFGWGYDGVDLFAPSRLYGTPDDLRALVDAAHRLELGVILDVVYNHLGPAGNYLTRFSPRYFGERPTEWGQSLNFDGEDAAAVREFFISNARYWIEEFHFDGLRLDATQHVVDTSRPHVLAEVARAVREAANGRATILVAENEPQDAEFVRPVAAGGCALDALWNDDFHHAALVALTGRREAYYEGYRGSPQELVSALKYGFLYQGEWYEWQRHARGSAALDLGPGRFVNYLENHDQVANTLHGRRLAAETSAGRLRAMTTLLLLAPQTPLLFMGQEFGASSPFTYFADHEGELAALVRDGRREFVAQFPSIAAPEATACVPDPGDPVTFLRCKLDWAERARHGTALALHRDLLRLRREDPVIRALTSRGHARGVDGAVIGDHAFLIRFFGGDAGDRLLVVNLGPRLDPDPLAEPLAAPPRGRRWRTLFSTESPQYGGWGTEDVVPESGSWRVPAECAVLLAPEPR